MTLGTNLEPVLLGFKTEHGKLAYKHKTCTLEKTKIKPGAEAFV